MKKHFIGIFIAALFLLVADYAQAQLTFINNTACPVRVTGTVSGSATPCSSGPYCNAGWISVPAFSSGVLPAPPCIGVAPPTFVRVGVRTSTGLFLGVSICGSPTQNYVDCTGTPRTLQQFSGSQAAVY